MIKLITGFRKDQEHFVSFEEAHKAYYLFLNPENRTVFSNGLAIKGSDIERIEPDYNALMGWNPSHHLDGDDYNEIRARGVDTKVRNQMSLAQEIARRSDESDLNIPLTQLLENKYPQLKSANL